MKHLLKTIIRNVKSVKGNSLAEFATTTALMATLAATAAPKLSEMSEGAKGEKSRNEIDKIIKQAGQFYQDTADNEGRGRFPNQKKFDVSIGGDGTGSNYDNGDAQSNGVAADHTRSNLHEAAILKDLGITTTTPTDGWDRYDEAHLNQWQSVFDANHTTSQSSGATPAGGIMKAQNYNANYTAGSEEGVTPVVAASGPANEWDSLFGDEVLESKFQDGHYVYTVVAGGGTGIDVYPPTIYVADVESAVDFNNVLMP